MKLCITGTRAITPLLEKRLIYVLNQYRKEYGSELIIFVGDAPGVDKHTRVWCNIQHPKVECQVFEADWKKYGFAAGPRRNQMMISRFPDRVLVFHTDPNLGTGTADCVRKARRAYIDVDLFIVPTMEVYNNENDLQDIHVNQL